MKQSKQMFLRCIKFPRCKMDEMDNRCKSLTSKTKNERGDAITSQILTCKKKNEATCKKRIRHN